MFFVLTFERNLRTVYPAHSPMDKHENESYVLTWKVIFFLKSLWNSRFHVECLNGICCFSKLLAHFCLDCRNLAPAGAMCEEREEDWTENQGIGGPLLALSLLALQPSAGIAIIKISETVSSLLHSSRSSQLFSGI